MVFLTSHVLQVSHEHDPPSDLLYAMNAKLARRMVKLGSSVDQPAMNFIRTVMENTDKTIHTRWSGMVKQAEPRYDLSRIGRLDFHQDLANTLPALDEWINSLAKREADESSVVFEPAPALVRYGQIP
jgi:hypothetical protein